VVTIDRLAGNESKPVTFKVRLNGISGTECMLRHSSTRGGVVEKKVCCPVSGMVETPRLAGEE